jgi:hypothetical protein
MQAFGGGNYLNPPPPSYHELMQGMQYHPMMDYAPPMSPHYMT